MTEPRPDVPFPEEMRAAVYEVIARRRDVRNFRPEAVPEPVLQRLLAAAHQAGSVGFMQPWDFIVARERQTRAGVYELFRRANVRANSRFADDRAATYAALKLQGVLDAPLGICVTCDTLRGGPHVLGRDSMPETDRYSTCLAIQNLWLAARAEGIGVGWVSIVDPVELARFFHLPDGVVPIAYLCVGYPVTMPDEPMLAATGWRQRLPLEAVVHSERWEARDVDAQHGAAERAPLTIASARWDAGSPSIERRFAAIGPPDPTDTIGAAVRERFDALAKPLGSLGKLERVCIRIARAQGTAQPAARTAHLLLFAADHGVVRHGVSAYRSEVTTKLCYNVIAGGAVVSSLARDAGVDVTLVDVGVDHSFDPHTALVHAKVRRATADLATESALTCHEVEQAIAAGIAAVHALPQLDVLLLGEIGIGNTTSAAALVALLLCLEAVDVVGAGTGIGDEALARKRDVIQSALSRVRRAHSNPDPLTALAEVGGLEIAALVGAMLAAAERGVPVILDGMIVGAAALVATALAPALVGYLIASHAGAERAHRLILERLALEPILQLELRLGEGSGAVLALPLVRGACRVLGDARTWEEAGLEAPRDERGWR